MTSTTACGEMMLPKLFDIFTPKTREDTRRTIELFETERLTALLAVPVMIALAHDLGRRPHDRRQGLMA